MLEGLCAQKKISRSDERGYAAAESAPRRPTRREEQQLEEEIRMPAREEKVLQLTVSVMKYRYTRFTGDDLDDLDLEDLVAKLSDLLLSSGFGNPYATDENDRTMQALHDAILDALFNGGVLPEETIERLLGDPADADQGDARSKLEELIQQIIERMAPAGVHLDAAGPRGGAGSGGRAGSVPAQEATRSRRSPSK